MGEFLFCAEVARRCKCVATPFAGNVPVFDVLVADERCRTTAVQVKTVNGGDWQFDARSFLAITFDEVAEQQVLGEIPEIEYPDLLLAFVWVDPKHRSRDRFFVLTRRELQRLIHDEYSRWLAKHGGRRPKNWKTTHCAVRVADVASFEDNWALITERLGPEEPAP
jgi:hypothetical protein